jgi:Cu/Ag efflux protein CusF
MRYTAILTLFWEALLLGGCGGGSEPAAPAASAPQREEHKATGTLNSIDQAAGTVNISHSPVPSAGWPEMTMSFKLADPGEAAQLKPGERVDFHFEIESGMNATITHIAPIE